MSETCRVIINQVKQKLHLVGYLLTRYFKDARYHEHKIQPLNVVLILTCGPEALIIACRKQPKVLLSLLDALPCGSIALLGCRLLT